MSAGDGARPRFRLPGAQFPWSIFWIALIVRLAALTLGHYYRFAPYEDHFGFGWEMGRIARSLATGQGFANPFDHPSGPTAWVTPLYPLLLGADFRVFGVYSALSAWIILAFGCVLNALMVGTTWEIAVRCFDRRVAVWSAWIWALYPAAMQFAVKWVWEMTVTAWFFSWILVLALRMRNIGGDADTDPASARRWVLFGLLWGLATLSSASVAIFLPFCGLWILWGSPSLRRQARRAALAAAVYLACIAPWSIRNTIVFHHFIPMRTNFGAELWSANVPGASGTLVGSPVALAPQEALLDRMGELGYSQWRGHMAMEQIRHHFGAFLLLSLRRFYFFWADIPHAYAPGKAWSEFFRSLNYQFATVAGALGLGLALRRRIPAAWLFAMAFATLPAMYYVTFPEARFRHPLEPLITILSVYLFQSAEHHRERRVHREPGVAHGAPG